MLVFLKKLWFLFRNGSGRIYKTEEFEVRIISQWDIIYKRGTFSAQIFAEPLQVEEGWVRGIHVTEDIKRNPEKNILNNTEADKNLILNNIEEAMNNLYEPFRWVQ